MSSLELKSLLENAVRTVADGAVGLTEARVVQRRYQKLDLQMLLFNLT
jgi:hypothetical protein